LRRLGTLDRALLLFDAFINLLLGLFLSLSSPAALSFFGLPTTNPAFYRIVLGATLFGIGSALLISLWSPSGLGLLGAVTINICGAGSVVAWLLFSKVEISPKGSMTLWIVSLGVLAIAVAELLRRPWRQ
jgi:hypothetical protein